MWLRLLFCQSLVVFVFRLVRPVPASSPSLGCLASGSFRMSFRPSGSFITVFVRPVRLSGHRSICVRSISFRSCLSGPRLVYPDMSFQRCSFFQVVVGVFVTVAILVVCSLAAVYHPAHSGWFVCFGRISIHISLFFLCATVVSSYWSCPGLIV